MNRLAHLLALALLVPACKTPPPPAASSPPVVTVDEAPGWRAEALPEDVARVEGVTMSWEAALDAARKAGFRRPIEAEDRLLDPSAALPFPAPSPGSYMCRTIKLAPATRRTRAFAAFKPFFCYVGADEDRLFLTKQTGTERPNGYLWNGEDSKSLIFLGSIALRPGDKDIAYGSDRSRDVAGLFQRIGPLRFRLVLPRGPGQLDLLELTPAPVQNEE